MLRRGCEAAFGRNHYDICDSALARADLGQFPTCLKSQPERASNNKLGEQLNHLVEAVNRFI